MEKQGKTKHEIAAEMAKGNLYAKNAILSLWDLRINDFTFSLGDGENEKYAFLSIPITEENQIFINLLYDVAHTMLRDNFGADICSEVYSVGNGENEHKTFFNIFVPSDNVTKVNVMFATVLGAHSEITKQPSYSNEIVENSKFLSDTLARSAILFRLRVNQDDMSIGITKAGHKELFERVFTDKSLAEYVDEFRNQWTFKYGTFKGDKKSLGMFKLFIEDVVKGNIKRK